MGVFHIFLNCTNSTKSRKASLKQLKVTCNSPCNCILVLITSNGFENKQAPQAATPPVKHSNKRPMISCVANSISEVNFLNAILQKTSPKQWYHRQSKTANQKFMVTSAIKCFFSRVSNDLFQRVLSINFSIWPRNGALYFLQAHNLWLYYGKVHFW